MNDLGHPITQDSGSLFHALDLTLRCPTCGARADMCFAHGDEWKKRNRSNPQPVHRMTDHELRASVNEFTQDDPPPYGESAPTASP